MHAPWLLLFFLDICILYNDNSRIYISLRLNPVKSRNLIYHLVVQLSILRLSAMNSTTDNEF
jgi:hypothetical protein